MARISPVNRLVVMFVTLATFIDGTSWRSKKQERSFKVYSNIAGYGSSHVIPVVTPCKDELKNCRKLKDLCHVKIVRQKCKETCWTCRAPAPPVYCSLTRFGCCWDNITISRGQGQFGCPVCHDKYDECSQFKSECSRRQSIRRLCPVSCGIDCARNQCEDDRYQAVVCPLYKKYGFCRINRSLMAKVCAKTCGLCSVKFRKRKII